MIIPPMSSTAILYPNEHIRRDRWKQDQIAKIVSQVIVVELMDMCTQLKYQRKTSAYTSRQRDRGSASKIHQYLHIVILFGCILFLVKYCGKSNGFSFVTNFV
jgi:hypothetical protein